MLTRYIFFTKKVILIFIHKNIDSVTLFFSHNNLVRPQLTEHPVETVLTPRVYLGMPLRINRNPRHALVEHYPQLVVYMTYLLVPLLYHVYFPLLRRVHVVEEPVEIDMELVIVVHQIMIVQHHVCKPVRLHL